MHRVINTGSFLQAYGLKSRLELLGHSVEFIDIHNPNTSSSYYTPAVPNWKRKLKQLRVFLKENHKEYLRSKRWDMFVYDLFDELGCGLKYNFDTSKYDLVLIGSDEVFNCTQEDSFWFKNLLLFGEGVKCRNVASYAASFGYTTLDRLEKFQLREKVAECLKRMNPISVRDANSFEVVEALTGKQASVNVDPVLMYEFEDEVSPKMQKADYMVVYSYDNRLVENDYVCAIKQYAKKNHLRIISVNFYLDWCDENIVVHPFEVLRYFRDASCVVTDTFHGAVMSIKYQKQFVAILRSSNTEKLGYLLEQFGLSERKVESSERIESTLDLKYDYLKVKELINDGRNKAVMYLAELEKYKG